MLGGHTFRCTRFGVTCAVGGATPDEMAMPGTKSGCHSNDSGDYLTRISDYIAFFKSLSPDPRNVMMAAIAGPILPFSVDPNAGNTVLDWSCMYDIPSGTDGASCDGSLELGTQTRMRYLVVLALVGCSGGDSSPPPGDASSPPSQQPARPVGVLAPQPNDKVDVLFMVDDSPGTLEYQTNLREQLPSVREPAQRARPAEAAHRRRDLGPRRQRDRRCDAGTAGGRLQRTRSQRKS